MQTKKIVINFNYPDDADISLEEIQNKITKTLKEELKSENVAWEITEEEDIKVNPTYPLPSYPNPTNPIYISPHPIYPDNVPWVRPSYAPSPYWWENQPTCTINGGLKISQEDFDKLQDLLKKNGKAKKE